MYSDPSKPGLGQSLIKGSITEITNQSGSVAQRYAYSSFGEIESQLDANFIQPYAFTSREFDTETGLYHYRQRQYDGTTGRFVQVDPAGFTGGINLYVGMASNPVNRLDPFGDQATAPASFGAPPVTGIPAGIPGSPVQPSVPNPSAIINFGNEYLLLLLMRQLSAEIEAKVDQIAVTIDCNQGENFTICFSNSHPLGSVSITKGPVIFASGTLSCFNRFIVGRKNCCSGGPDPLSIRQMR